MCKGKGGECVNEKVENECQGECGEGYANARSSSPLSLSLPTHSSQQNHGQNLLEGDHDYPSTDHPNDTQSNPQAIVYRQLGQTNEW